MKTQKDYIVPYAVHLNIMHLDYGKGKLKDRQKVLVELETLSVNYKKENISVKGFQELITDLKNKNIELTIKGDAFATVCIGRTRMTV